MSCNPIPFAQRLYYIFSIETINAVEIKGVLINLILYLGKFCIEFLYSFSPYKHPRRQVLTLYLKQRWKGKGMRCF
ncbi:MAG: hypothetical protein ETSY2_44745 [Candidatus Entotheonella gemina]|uniref:Uncharacterized protein n=1 Tax=Candidatus Entotheonella gemina TaxID=1429439 RepID=W4LHC3_9BACT|nr:MAG: hypothetical protein ETSY2_44745 [Candidatus Entotheonella gemina]